GFTGSLSLQPARLLAPLYGSDWNAQPSATFTSRLSTERSPSPLLDITTTARDCRCWRGLSPAGMAASLAARSIATHTRCPSYVRLSVNLRHDLAEKRTSKRARKRLMHRNVIRAKKRGRLARQSLREPVECLVQALGGCALGFFNREAASDSVEH